MSTYINNNNLTKSACITTGKKIAKRKFFKNPKKENSPQREDRLQESLIIFSHPFFMSTKETPPIFTISSPKTPFIPSFSKNIEIGHVIIFKTSLASFLPNGLANQGEDLFPNEISHWERAQQPPQEN